MKNHLEKAIKHPLISGASILFFGSIFTNLANFLFNLFISRNLTVNDYGIFARVVSLSTLPMYAAGSITPTIVNFAASYFANNELGKARMLYKKVNSFSIGIGIFIFVLLLIFNQMIGAFFKIPSFEYIFIVGLLVLLSYAGVINAAFLQARLAFPFITFSNFLSALIKLIAGVVFVLQGFGVFGAVLSYLISVIFTYILSFIPIRDIFAKHLVPVKIGIPTILRYGAPASLAFLAFTSFTTTDILLVGHFFSPHDAGLYSGLSLVGRTIFFLSAPVATVMFPLVVHRYEKNENYFRLLMLSIILVLVPSIAVLIFYSQFPEFVILLFLKQKAYLKIAYLITYFGFFISEYSISFVLINYLLSIKKTKVVVPVILCSLAQIAGIWFYHKTFLQVIIISSVSIFVLICIQLFFCFESYGKKR